MFPLNLHPREIDSVYSIQIKICHLDTSKRPKPINKCICYNAHRLRMETGAKVQTLLQHLQNEIEDEPLRTKESKMPKDA
jgi:hypothetical protein